MIMSGSKGIWRREKTSAGGVASIKGKQAASSLVVAQIPEFLVSHLATSYSLCATCATSNTKPQISPAAFLLIVGLSTILTIILIATLQVN